MERKEALAGGGADGRSAFFRLPRWCVAGVVTYPLNTESRSRDKKKNRPKCAGNVNASRLLRDGTGFIQPDLTNTHKLDGFPLAHTTKSKNGLAARALLKVEAFNRLVETCQND